MKLSIIIPVYRTEHTLDRCIESMLSQGIDDYEILLVDDGSPDRCPEICDNWAQRERNIRVIHKTNGGLSDARNAGIEAAKGELITFVDSDDYLQENTYSKIIPQAHDDDIVEFPIYCFYGSERQTLLKLTDNVYDSPGRYWLKAQAYRHPYACNKIFKRQLFDGIRFPKGKVFEDAYTLPRLLQKVSSIATTSQGIYYYCQNDQGITANAQGPQLEMLLNAHLETLRTWADDSYYLHVLNIQIDVYEQTGKNPVLLPHAVNPFASGLSISLRLKAIALNFLDIRRLCILFKTIHRWKKPHS